MTVTQLLYRTARIFRDVNAVQRGKVPQRIMRKALGRLAGRTINRLVR